MISFASAPIDPTWITAGSPVAEVSPIASDGTVSTGYWRCTEGQFVWRYDVDETIVLLSGAAIIYGLLRTAGATLQFARGTSVAWEILETVTKMYVIQKPPPIHRRVIRKLKRLIKNKETS